MTSSSVSAGFHTAARSTSWEVCPPRALRSAS